MNGADRRLPEINIFLEKKCKLLSVINEKQQTDSFSPLLHTHTRSMIFCLNFQPPVPEHSTKTTLVAEATIKTLVAEATTKTANVPSKIDETTTDDWKAHPEDLQESKSKEQHLTSGKSRDQKEMNYLQK